LKQCLRPVHTRARPCKGTVHAQCCYELANSAAFTAKVAAWTTAGRKQAEMGAGCHSWHFERRT